MLDEQTIQSRQFNQHRVIKTRFQDSPGPLFRQERAKSAETFLLLRSFSGKILDE